MSAAATVPAGADRGKELDEPPSGGISDQRNLNLASFWGKTAGIYDIDDANVHKGEFMHHGAVANDTASRELADCEHGGSEVLQNLPFRHKVVADQLEDLQISSPLCHAIMQENSNISLQEPGSPASPSARSPPAVYFSPLSTYRPPPTMPRDRELYYEDLMVKFTSLAMKRFESVQDEVIPNIQCQSVELAESALQYHNIDPNNKVKYELIKATESSYIFEVDSAYGHVNFIAKAHQEGSEEQLFFAELRLQGDTTSLTCFCCLKEKGDQIGGLMEMDRKGKGVDLKHCYACGDAMKHPRDGASYHAGHCTGREHYECP